MNIKSVVLLHYAVYYTVHTKYTTCYCVFLFVP